MEPAKASHKDLEPQNLKRSNKYINCTHTIGAQAQAVLGCSLVSAGPSLCGTQRDLDMQVGASE